MTRISKKQKKTYHKPQYKTKILVSRFMSPDENPFNDYKGLGDMFLAATWSQY